MNNDLSLKKLGSLYIKRRLSASEISRIFNCSENKINYWIRKYKIAKRTISDAIYIKHNPKGDPFKIKNKLNKSEAELKGLGLGIYWGEGDKSKNTLSAVRVGNTDPFLIKKFREFLIKICGAKREKLKYSLEIFNDSSEEGAIKVWNRHLGIKKEQLGKIIILPSRGKGTYRKKNETGVLMIAFYNKKLKEEIIKMLNGFI